MKKLVLCLVPALFLGACATSSRVSYPSGEKGFAVTCPGTNQEMCMNKAAELCGGGAYNVIGEQNWQVSGAFMTRTAFTAFSVPQFKMNVVCAFRQENSPIVSRVETVAPQVVSNKDMSAEERCESQKSMPAMFSNCVRWERNQISIGK